MGVAVPYRAAVAQLKREYSGFSSIVYTVLEPAQKCNTKCCCFRAWEIENPMELISDNLRRLGGLDASSSNGRPRLTDGRPLLHCAIKGTEQVDTA